MAAPVVSGLAALIREYFPNLTAAQVKDIMLKSVVKVDQKVRVVNGSGDTVMIPFSQVCITGGIINAFNALQLAARYN
jgi:subtilisin family serine protease